MVVVIWLMFVFFNLKGIQSMGGEEQVGRSVGFTATDVRASENPTAKGGAEAHEEKTGKSINKLNPREHQIREVKKLAKRAEKEEEREEEEREEVRKEKDVKEDMESTDGAEKKDEETERNAVFNPDTTVQNAESGSLEETFAAVSEVDSSRRVIADEDHSFQFDCDLVRVIHNDDDDDNDTSGSHPVANLTNAPSKTTVHYKGHQVAKGSKYKFIGVNKTSEEIRANLGPYQCMNGISVVQTIDVTSKPLLLFINHTKNKSSNVTSNKLRLEKGLAKNVLICRVYSHPDIISLKWIHPNGSRLEAVHIHSDGGESSITLSLISLAESDSGKYTCEAANEIGTTNSSVHLHIINPWDAIWPTLAIVVEVVILTSIILSCEKIQKRKTMKRRQREKLGTTEKPTKQKGKQKAEQKAKTAVEGRENKNMNQNNDDMNKNNDVYGYEDDDDDENDDVDAVQDVDDDEVPTRPSRAQDRTRKLSEYETAAARDAVETHFITLARIRSTQSECIPDWRRDTFEI